ncbi:MAG: hypothetical protein ACOC1F_01385, partial [Myxococcota bacterium]
CANGVNPCAIDPCFGPDDCAVDEVCIEMLCWPASNCSGGTCGVGIGPDGSESCDCAWPCDGVQYGFACTSTQNTVTCECLINGEKVKSCGGGSGGSGGAGGGGPMPDPCNAGACCGFPL